MHMMETWEKFIKKDKVFTFKYNELKEIDSIFSEQINEENKKGYLKQKSKRLAELNVELDMEQPRNSTSQSQQNAENKTKQKQETQATEEVKKPSILTALHNFKPKENTTEIKKQREVVL